MQGIASVSGTAHTCDRKVGVFMSQFSPKTLMRNAFARTRAARASSGDVREELLRQAAAELEDALAQARQAGPEGRDLLAKALIMRAELAQEDGDLLRARAFLDELIALEREGGSIPALAEALTRLAELDLACGARGSALDGFDEAVELLRGDETAGPGDLARLLSAKADLLARSGNKSEARTSLFEAAALYAQCEDDDGVITCQSKIAELALG